MSTDIDGLIVRTADVLGGKPRIDGTRVSVQTVAIWYRRGYTAEEIAVELEQVSLAQIYAALAYYHANQAEMEAELQAETELHDRLMQEHYQHRASA
ncbi:MAG TPA: DUF433 domain-containing protein [Rhodothermales bacterium]|nr:DUF433 domain-containing protein [Rhodothermales bacterium]